MCVPVLVPECFREEIAPINVSEDKQDASLFPAVDWDDLVTRVYNGEESGMEELYALFSRGIRYRFCRNLGSQELDDKVHDTFIIVTQAIQRGNLHEPSRLMGFVRTIVRRQIAAHIDNAVHSRRDRVDLDMSSRVQDPRSNPEQATARRQDTQLMLDVLESLPGRDREILTRFYLRDQTQEKICGDMGLTETQFRLTKSRAKARFGEVGKKKLKRISNRAIPLWRTA